MDIGTLIQDSTVFISQSDQKGFSTRTNSKDAVFPGFKNLGSPLLKVIALATIIYIT